MQQIVGYSEKPRLINPTWSCICGSEAVSILIIMDYIAVVYKFICLQLTFFCKWDYTGLFIFTVIV